MNRYKFVGKISILYADPCICQVSCQVVYDFTKRTCLLKYDIPMRVNQVLRKYLFPIDDLSRCQFVSDLLHMINVSLISSISLDISENVNSLASRITLLVLISQNGYAPSKTTREQLKFCFSNFSEKIFFPWWPFKVLMECVRFFFLEKSMSSFSNMTKEQIKSPHFSENIHFPWGPLKLSILFRFVKTTWRNEMWQKTNSSSQNLSQNIYFPWGPLRMPVCTQFLKTTCRFQM